jgi:hypothetical protein
MRTKYLAVCLVVLPVAGFLAAVEPAMQCLQEGPNTAATEKLEKTEIFTPPSEEVLFDTFGPGDSYYCCNLYTLGCWGVNYQPAAAFSFAGASSFRLETITVVTDHDWNTWNHLTIRLMTDAGGSPNDTIDVMDLPVSLGSSTIKSATSTFKPLLDPGVTHWLVLSVPVDNCGGWNASNPPVLGSLLFRSGEEGEWFSTSDAGLPAFRVTGIRAPAVGAETPIPALDRRGVVLMVIATALAAIGRLRSGRVPL